MANTHRRLRTAWLRSEKREHLSLPGGNSSSFSFALGLSPVELVHTYSTQLDVTSVAFDPRPSFGPLSARSPLSYGIHTQTRLASVLLSLVAAATLPWVGSPEAREEGAGGRDDLHRHEAR